MSKEEKEADLRELGDPSGHRDSQYWNDWFRIVDNDRNDPFEWYTSSEEVARVLSSYMVGEDFQVFKVAHPGSGTSMLPLKLGDIFPNSYHTVIDTSAVAIEKIKKIHEKVGISDDLHHRIDYMESDLLRFPYDIENGYYSFWVDKGFHDAVFSSDDHHADQSNDMYREVSRILDENGVAVIVSLAEAHSLKLIVNCWSQPRCWGKYLDVWELQPLSGNLRVFAFVLSKKHLILPSDQMDQNVRWHYSDGSTQYIAVSNEDLYDSLLERVEDSRRTFVERIAPSVSTKGVTSAVLLRLEIKPYDAESDLNRLGEVIRSNEWFRGELERTKINIVWHHFSEPTILQEVVPIGFGISKLLLQCIVASEDVDHLVEAIVEWEGDNDAFADGVQSIDIDWSNTAPISNGDAILRSRIVHM